MRWIIRLALCLIPVTQAQATEFRCYPPDPEEYFQAVMASPDSYQIVQGQFQFDPALLPFRAGSLLFPKQQPIPARFEGAVLRAGGFAPVPGFDLTILPRCVMVSCPVFEPGVAVIAFVRLGHDGPVLDADPCLSPLFAATEDTAALLIQLTQ
jgi:hypothetical protein